MTGPGRIGQRVPRLIESPEADRPVRVRILRQQQLVAGQRLAGDPHVVDPTIPHVSRRTVASADHQGTVRAVVGRYLMRDLRDLQACIRLGQVLQIERNPGRAAFAQPDADGDEVRTVQLGT